MTLHRWKGIQKRSSSGKYVRYKIKKYVLHMRSVMCQLLITLEKETLSIEPVLYEVRMLVRHVS